MMGCLFATLRMTRKRTKLSEEASFQKELSAKFRMRSKDCHPNKHWTPQEMEEKIKQVCIKVI